MTDSAKNLNGMPLVRRRLRRGLQDGVFPGAVLLAALRGEVVLLDACGAVSLDAGAPAVTAGTLFDLASLTKPLATGLAVMKLVDEERLGLDQPLQTIFECALPAAFQRITPRLLLCHAAGLKDWHPFYLELAGVPAPERKQAVRRAILAMPLVHEPAGAVLYSDLGYMILEWVVEAAAGLPLDRYVEESFYRPLGLTHIGFRGRGAACHEGPVDIAATERCSWRGRVIQGEVHDENAAFVGGVAGHAGLFGTALEIHEILSMLLRHFHGEESRFFRVETVHGFMARQFIGGESTWALGWDTPSGSGSSAGRLFSPQSVGHLGFTGTSVWMDLERGVEMVLLTNRVHPSRENIRIRGFRPLIHDAVMEELLG